MLKIYGIRNCDSCRKACRWLEANAIKYNFHDLRKDGIDTDLLESWFKRTEWTTLLNKRSTTWRQLSESQREKLDKTKVLNLMSEHPTLIKRPVAIIGKKITVGFNEDCYREHVVY